MVIRIQRYIPIRKDAGEYFGPHVVGNGTVLDWYVSTDSPERIGITSNLSQTEGNALIGEMFNGSGDLIFSRKPTYIQRTSTLNNSTIVAREDQNPAQVLELIEGIQKRGLRYMFLASKLENGSLSPARPAILTFSATPPSPALYHTGSRAGIGPIEVRLS